MLPETFVFNGDKRVYQVFRYFHIVNPYPVFISLKLRENIPFNIVNECIVLCYLQIGGIKLGRCLYIPIDKACSKAGTDKADHNKNYQY